MNKEWEMFLSRGRDMEKIAMWEAQKAEDQREARKEQVDGGKRGEKDQKQGMWTAICGKRKSSKV